MEISLNLTGVEQVKSALSRLDDAIQRRVHDQLLLWAELVKDSAMRNVPVRTGYLRSTIYAAIKDWVGEIGAEATYSAFVEFGTRYMRAQPFIFPALQEHLPVLEEIIGEAIEAAKAEVGL